MSRIKYYDEVTGRWEYADQAHGSDSGQNVNQYTFLNSQSNPNPKPLHPEGQPLRRSK